MAETSKCPKCAGEMSDGFIADYSYGSVQPNKWVAGEPEKSFWSGTKIGDKEQRGVTAFRCIKCGYLEFYAN